MQFVDYRSTHTTATPAAQCFINRLRRRVRAVRWWLLPPLLLAACCSNPRPEVRDFPPEAAAFAHATGITRVSVAYEYRQAPQVCIPVSRAGSYSFAMVVQELSHRQPQRLVLATKEVTLDASATPPMMVEFDAGDEERSNCNYWLECRFEGPDSTTASADVLLAAAW